MGEPRRRVVLEGTQRFSVYSWAPAHGGRGESPPAQGAAAGPDRGTFDRIMGVLRSRAVPFRHLTHEAVRTSEEAARVRGVPLHTGAKAMLLKEKKSGAFKLVVISAAAKIDFKKVRKAVTKNSRAASEEEVVEVSGALPGSVPPFGSLFARPTQTYMDLSLRRQGDQISFNAGLKTESVTMQQADYEAIEAPIVVDVSASAAPA